MVGDGDSDGGREGRLRDLSLLLVQDTVHGCYHTYPSGLLRPAALVASPAKGSSTPLPLACMAPVRAWTRRGHVPVPLSRRCPRTRRGSASHFGESWVVR